MKACEETQYTSVIRTELPNATDEDVAAAEKALDTLVLVLLRIALEASGGDASLPVIEID